MLRLAPMLSRPSFSPTKLARAAARHAGEVVPTGSQTAGSGEQVKGAPPPEGKQMSSEKAKATGDRRSDARPAAAPRTSDGSDERGERGDHLTAGRLLMAQTLDR